MSAIKGGNGGTGGATSTPAGDGVRGSRFVAPSRFPSGSSTSVSTARSPAVSVDEAAIDRRFEDAGRERSRVIAPPVILLKWYVENRLDARRSSASLFLSAASELATAGVSGASMGGVCGGDASTPLVSFRSGEGSSMTTVGGDVGGGETGLSTRE